MVTNKFDQQFKYITITSEGFFENDEEYLYSELSISHDGGKDKKLIQRYNQVQEIMNLSVGEVIGDYLDELT